MVRLHASIPLAVVGFALFASCEESGHSVANAPEYDVAIIGGGSAGTYSAINLKDAGKSIIIIEMTDELGGNANTYVDKSTGTVVNVGVIDLHNISVVTDYAARLGVPLANPGPYNLTQKYYDFDTGKTVPNFTYPSDTAFGEALIKYIDIVQTNYSYLGAGWFLPDPVPQELLVPFGEFTRTNGITAVNQLFNEILQNIGDLWSVPTAQVIKAVDLSTAQSLLEGFLVVASGNTRDLYTSAEKILANDVLYKSEVTSVNRSQSGKVMLTVETPKGKKTINAKTLLIAIPPTVEKLQAFDLSSSEKDVFDKFEAVGYCGAIIHNTGINSSSTTLQNIGTNTPFHLENEPGIFTLGPTGIDDVYAVYYGTISPSVSSKTVKQGIVSQIDTLASHGLIGKGSTEFLYFTNHAPFRLHVSAEEIKAGFYSDLYALQGQQNTFWTGAAWTTQDSSLIWNFTKYEVLPKVLQRLDSNYS